MADARKKPLARSIGEFLGHIIKAVRTKPAEEASRTTVRHTDEEEDRGNVVLRRTTVEEIEIKQPDREPKQ